MTLYIIIITVIVSVLAFYQDGPNADRYGNDFELGRRKITAEQRMRIRLAPGGGWAARISH